MSTTREPNTRPTCSFPSASNVASLNGVSGLSETLIKFVCASRAAATNRTVAVVEIARGQSHPDFCWQGIISPVSFLYRPLYRPAALSRTFSERTEPSALECYTHGHRPSHAGPGQHL